MARLPRSDSRQRSVPPVHLGCGFATQGRHDIGEAVDSTVRQEIVCYACRRCLIKMKGTCNICLGLKNSCPVKPPGLGPNFALEGGCLWDHRPCGLSSGLLQEQAPQADLN